MNKGKQPLEGGGNPAESAEQRGWSGHAGQAEHLRSNHCRDILVVAYAPCCSPLGQRPLRCYSSRQEPCAVILNARICTGGAL